MDGVGVNLQEVVCAVVYVYMIEQAMVLFGRCFA